MAVPPFDPPALMSRSLSRSALLAAALLAAICDRSAAAEPVDAIESVEVGLARAYRSGEWTPLTVRLTSGEASAVVIETVTSDADGSTVVRRTVPVPVPVEAGRVRLVFQAGRRGSDLTVRLLRPTGELVAERRLRHGTNHLPDAVPRERPVWVVSGGLETLAGREAGFPAPDNVAAAAVPTAGLPAEFRGYAAADAVLVRGDLSPDPGQAEALRRYVAAGGHLVVALGERTEAFRSGPLAAWVPIPVEGTMRLQNIAPLNELGGGPRRLPGSARIPTARLGGSPPLKFGVSPERPDEPLVASAPYGFGRVTLIAVDLDRPPVSTWPGLPGLIARSVVEEEPTSSGRLRSISVPGVTEFATQIARAEDVFPGVERPGHGTVLLYLLAYAVVVGPLDYLLVHRLLRRPALTWITLPVLVGLAVLGLSAAGSSTLAASRFNQLDLVDVDAATGTLRGRSAVTLYSSDSARCDLELAPRTGTPGADAVPRLAWSAPPEEAFGGVDREAAGGLFRPEYRLLPPEAAVAAEGVPLLVGGTRRFEATWLAGETAGLVESDVSRRGRGPLEGRVAHRLPAPLVEWVIVYGDRVLFPPADLAWKPNEAVPLDADWLGTRDLSQYLTRSTFTQKSDRRPGEGGSDLIVTQTAYDPASTDLGLILRTLTFHAAAGGRGYTGLANTGRASDDLTTLLRLDRAIVLGRLAAPAADVAVASGETAFEPARRDTFVRFVLPVRRLPQAEEDRGEPLEDPEGE